jgi:peptidoglycan/LPS O-acetylase OafA/YrhL
VEEHFYIVIALLYSFFFRRQKSPRPLLWLLIAALVISPILRSIAVYEHVEPVWIQGQTQYRIDALASGVLLAWISNYNKSLFERMLSYRWLWAVATILGTAILIAMPHEYPFKEILGYSITWMIGSAFILSVYQSKRVAKVSPYLRWLGFLGVIAYPLYIWHLAIARVVAKGLETRLADHADLLLIIQYACVILVAYAVARTLERPSMMLRNRLFPAVAFRVDAMGPQDTIPVPRTQWAIIGKRQG